MPTPNINETFLTPDYTPCMGRYPRLIIVQNNLNYAT